LEIEKEYAEAYNDRTEKHSILRNEMGRCDGLEYISENLVEIDLSQLHDELANIEKNNANYKYVSE
jgi:hypothetical protein